MAQRRRAQGEGTVYFDEKRGSWVAQADLGVNPRTGKRRRIKVRASTKREASARLRARVEELDRLDSSAVPVSVAELMELWLSRVAPKSMSVNTLSSVRSMVDNHILPSLGSLPLRGLRVEHVEALLDAKKAEGLSRSSLVKLHSYLGQAFEMGVRRRLVAWNPARVAVVPDAPRSREGRALIPTEVRALLNAADRDRLGAWLTVAVTTGLRPGEVSGLMWDAIDLEAGSIVVFRSLAWQRSEPVLKSPKTNRTRTISLPERTRRSLVAHRQAMVTERLRAGPLWPDKWADLIFVTSNGTPIDPSNLRRLVARLASEAEIEGRVTPYDLRHTATSILSATGVAPELLADLLGHVDTRMVFRHYRHPITPTIDVAARFIDDALDL